MQIQFFNCKGELIAQRCNDHEITVTCENCNLESQIEWPSNVDPNASREVLAVCLGEAWEIISKLRDLHQPNGSQNYSREKSEFWCGTCEDEGSDGEYGVPWPCATIRVINGDSND